MKLLAVFSLIGLASSESVEYITGSWSGILEHLRFPLFDGVYDCAALTADDVSTASMTDLAKIYDILAISYNKKKSPICLEKVKALESLIVNKIENKQLTQVLEFVKAHRTIYAYPNVDWGNVRDYTRDELIITEQLLQIALGRVGRDGQREIRRRLRIVRSRLKMGK